MLFFVECISTILSVNVSILILLWTTWIGNFLSCCFPQPTVYILYSLQSKVIRTGSALETTTCSSQSATVLVVIKSFIIRSLFRFKYI